MIQSLAVPVACRPEQLARGEEVGMGAPQRHSDQEHGRHWVGWLVRLLRQILDGPQDASMVPREAQVGRTRWPWCRRRPEDDGDGFVCTARSELHVLALPVMAKQPMVALLAVHLASRLSDDRWVPEILSERVVE